MAAAIAAAIDSCVLVGACRDRRVGGGHAGLLRAQQHLGAHVLDGLEAADRLAELFAHLGVLGGGVQRPLRDTGGFGGQHRGGQVLEPPPRRGEPGGRRGRQRDLRQRTGEVGRLQQLDSHTVAGGVDHHDVVIDGKQQQPGGVRAQHVVDGPRDPAVLVAQIGAQRRTGGQPTRGQAVEQARIVDHQRGQRRRGDRAGHERRGGLVDHGAQILDRCRRRRRRPRTRPRRTARVRPDRRRRDARRPVRPVRRPARRHAPRQTQPNCGPVHARQTVRR